MSTTLWQTAAPPKFGKNEVRCLLELMSGEERPLTVKQLRQWRDLILYAVASMRSVYENERIAKDYPIREYYAPHWERIAQASTDEAMVEALEELRYAIQWE